MKFFKMAIPAILIGFAVLALSGCGSSVESGGNTNNPPIVNPGDPGTPPTNPSDPGTSPENPGTPIEPVHPQPIPPNATLDSMFIKPDGGVVPVGVSGQLKAYGVYSDGTESDLTSVASWDSSDASVVEVGSDGMATAVKAGEATIRAQKDGISATVTFAVKPLEVKSLDLKFANGSTDVTVPQGTTGTLVATALLSDGEHVNATPYVSFVADPAGIASFGVHGFVKADNDGSTSIVAKYNSIKSNSVSLTVTGAVFDHLEIQEGYAGEDGNGKVITGQTIGLQIADEVNYDPVSPEAYYPTAWAVYSDGSKRYVNTEASWWSADMARVYVNSVQGSFVFGRGVTDSPVEVRATYRGDEVPNGSVSASFFVTVTSPINHSLIEIGIKNTEEYGWGCDDYDPAQNKEITVKVGKEKSLMACGLYFDEKEGKEVWEDINNNVAWFSDNRDVAFVRTSNGKLVAESEGDATISAKLEGKEGSILVHVAE